MDSDVSIGKSLAEVARESVSQSLSLSLSLEISLAFSLSLQKRLSFIFKIKGRTDVN